MIKIQRNDTYNLIVEGKSKGIDENYQTRFISIKQLVYHIL